MSNFPVVLIYGNNEKNAELGDTTIDELKKVSRAAWPNEFRTSEVTFWENNDNGIQMEGDSDIEDAFDAIQPDDSDDDSESGDSDEEDNEVAQPLYIIVNFKKIEIKLQSPNVTSINAAIIKSTTVSLQWEIERSNLTNPQKASLYFEIKQLSPPIQSKLKNEDSIVAEIKPNMDSYQCKLFGLQALTKYKFTMRSKFKKNITDNHYITSDWCPKPVHVNTPKTSLLSASSPSNKSIAPPSDLQVTALYHDKVTLAWNHVNDQNKQYDYEYYIEEHNIYTGEIIAAVESHTHIVLQNLQSSTRYQFSCRAKYYDPERKISDDQFNNMLSNSSNVITIRTPGKNHDAADFKNANVRQMRWSKTGNELQLFWTAPEQFCGEIQYQLLDFTNSNKPIGMPFQKLPVTVSTRSGNDSIFGKIPGKFVIGVRPELHDSKQRIQCNPSKIEFSIEDEKMDYSSASMLSISLRLTTANGDETRTIEANTEHCDFGTFKEKVKRAFGLKNPDELRFKMAVSNINGSTEHLDVNHVDEWDVFLRDHGMRHVEKNTGQPLTCFVVKPLSKPTNVNVSKKSDHFEITCVKTSGAYKYALEVRAQKDMSSGDHVQLRNAEQMQNTNRFVYKPDAFAENAFFQFRVKCINPHTSSDFSKWTSLIQFKSFQNLQHLNRAKSFSPSAQSPTYHHTSSPHAQSSRFDNNNNNNMSNNMNNMNNNNDSPAYQAPFNNNNNNNNGNTKPFSPLNNLKYNNNNNNNGNSPLGQQFTYPQQQPGSGSGSGYGALSGALSGSSPSPQPGSQPGSSNAANVANDKQNADLGILGQSPDPPKKGDFWGDF